MITVQVISRSSGKPATGKRVNISFDSLFRGMGREQRTDSRGQAHFSHDPGNGKVYVDGRTVYQGNLKGCIVVHV
ncbi:hypothetical protein IQ215_02630 [Cyanobacterium stanieri LEGE 03274]|uniref:Uncharacterized protein n=1 Tax=Cyanobacterium stanieri LEGE 03274 TaxID=1828756 RepID=A0ABR9V120_9CHRO|nr:hypothetical protein [Cyanobacterium stanieri]MBE9221583.1 hypothetical protein [Cyanobacterium stanieri LEGE 03274]